MPTPPNTTSLIDRLENGTAPPRPVSDSSAPFTAPHEVTVVTAEKSAVLAMPKRCSLPSRLPPVEPEKWWVVTPARCWAGVPCCSAV